MLSICYATSFNLPVAVTRCGNFFGGGDLNWNRIIPGTIRSVIRNEIPIIRSDGKLIRDYIYVEDAVSAYMTLSQALTLDPSLRGEAFNFSNETQKTVYDLTLCIIKLLDSNVKPIIQGKNINEIKAQYLDSSKAKKILSWYPEFGFEEGLKKTIEWYKKYLGSN
jgi:CDP-glucose 4,6-dehydratase